MNRYITQDCKELSKSSDDIKRIDELVDTICVLNDNEPEAMRMKRCVYKKVLSRLNEGDNFKTLYEDIDKTQMDVCVEMSLCPII
jgi:hypothetical protein